MDDVLTALRTLFAILVAGFATLFIAPAAHAIVSDYWVGPVSMSLAGHVIGGFLFVAAAAAASPLSPRPPAIAGCAVYLIIMVGWNGLSNLGLTDALLVMVPGFAVSVGTVALVHKLRMRGWLRLAALILALGLGLGFKWVCFPGWSFDRAAWDQAEFVENSPRFHMAERFVASGALIGRSRHELIELLGPSGPENGTAAGMSWPLAPGSDDSGTFTWQLSLDLDEAGRATGCSITH